MADLKRKIKGPIGDRLMVRVDVAEKTTPGGIIKPDDYREDANYAQCEAKIIKLGETANAMELDEFPAEGDYILMDRYAGKEFIEPDGAECRMIRGDDIIATLEASNG